MRISTSDLDRLLGAWRHRGSTLPAALAEGLTALVLDGRLPIGTQLPAERALASAVGVSRVTVSAVDGTRFSPNGLLAPHLRLPVDVHELDARGALDRLALAIEDSAKR